MGITMHVERRKVCSRTVFWPLLTVVLTLVAVLLSATTAGGSEVDGFTEPFRTVEVAAVETGTIKSIEVKEGQRVTRGQVLARLDDDVHLALLAIAEEAMRAEGQLKSAQAEAKLRLDRLAKLQALRGEGHARQEEVDRAQADFEIAKARVLNAEEQLLIKQLECRKMRIQLDRRTVRAPIDGVIKRLHKDPGEFVAPNDPYVLELVDLDKLTGNFAVPSREAVRLQEGQAITVGLDDVDEYVTGIVEFVSPVTDAESGTIRVKVRVPNSEGKYRSGERCTLYLDRTSRITRP
jgi:RND family efflux transporter MFP subunit